METVFAVSFSVTCVIWTLLAVIACMPGKEKRNEIEKGDKGIVYICKTNIGKGIRLVLQRKKD